MSYNLNHAVQNAASGRKARQQMDMGLARSSAGVEPNRREQLMWSGFDPELRKELAIVREMSVRRHQTPTKEWPFVFIKEFDTLLVVREWPDGTITAYATSEFSDAFRDPS